MKKIVLITGAAGGIGSTTAKLFAAEDWLVIGVDINSNDSLSDVDYFINADISNVKDSKRIFEYVAKKEGHLDALVNNAAIQICKPLIETTPEEWDSVMTSNLRGVYLSVRNAYPLMRSIGGSIVNISSVHALATSANIAAYAASKGAILSLTRALAIELASDKIRVNAVLPGAIDTPMLRAGLNRGHLDGRNLCELINQLGNRHILRRVGQPIEIAHIILFLSDYNRSSFITGQSIVADGGALARLSTE